MFSNGIVLSLLLTTICFGGLNAQADKTLEDFKNGKRIFRVGDQFQAYNALVPSAPKYYTATRTNDNCIGVIIDNFELIILDCPGNKPKEPGCLEVVALTSNNQNKARQKVKVCATLDNRCVTVTTPRNIKVLLWCPVPILGNVANIKNNGEPPRE